MEQRNIIDNIE